MTYFLHYSHYLKRARRHINRHYSWLFLLPVLNYCLCLKAEWTGHVIANIGVIAFIAIIDECACLTVKTHEWRFCMGSLESMVWQLFRMTMSRTKLAKNPAIKLLAHAHHRHLMILPHMHLLHSKHNITMITISPNNTKAKQ